MQGLRAGVLGSPVGSVPGRTGLREVSEPERRGDHQVWRPWHEFEQLRVLATQPVVATTSLTPLRWVAETTVVVL
jgi:hypothetical protein